MKNVVKTLWIKYHFIVPFSVYKKGFKLAWGKVTNRSPYLDPMNKVDYSLWARINKSKKGTSPLIDSDYVLFVGDEGYLDDSASYYINECIKDNKGVDVIYYDEDKVDKNGQAHTPFFKPDWSPDTFRSFNYIGNSFVIRKSLISNKEKQKNEKLLEDAVLKAKRIVHIPRVLYHEKTTNETRKHIESKESFKKEPLVSVVIPARDHARTTKKCLDSIFKKTTYKNYEVILANNRSEKKETFELFDSYKNSHENFRVINADFDFNYSKINNYAVRQAKGDYVILLNNDTEVITPEWMSKLVWYASLSHVGAVGAKLLYPDNTIQHIGVALGLGGVAGHVYLNAKRNESGPYGLFEGPYDCGAVTAACLCVSKKKYEEVGGLDEKNLKVAFNDIDFCVKLLSKGYYNVVLPDVELYHYESKSRGLDYTYKKRKRFNSEVRFMKKKWGDVLKHDKFYNANYSLEKAYMLDRKRKTR